MIGGGDELGRTQGGNNNAHCQDGSTSWYDWTATDDSRAMTAFTARAVRLQAAHPVLRRRSFLTGSVVAVRTLADVTWIGADGAPLSGDDVLVLANAGAEPVTFPLPGRRGAVWTIELDSDIDDGTPASAQPLAVGRPITVAPLSLVVAVAPLPSFAARLLPGPAARTRLLASGPLDALPTRGHTDTAAWIPPAALLTPEFVEVARELTARCGLDGLVEVQQGSGTDLPFPAGSFDAACLLHVGMNIEDKATLFAEIRRVLMPGGRFGLYEVMRTGDGEVGYPVPWATVAATSFLLDPAGYRRLLSEAKFEVLGERDRREFALDSFAQMRARIAQVGSPPLGLHIVFGADHAAKTANMIDNLRRREIAPVEMVCRAR